MIEDIKPAAPKQQPVQVGSVQPDDTTTPQKPVLKILCVEDEPFIGDLYKKAFEKAGYYCEVIADGYEGLDRAKSDEFDIILLDIMIPQILGIDVLTELRKISGLKAKIVIATNLEQDEQTRAKIEEQADAYVIKAEITPTELVDFVRKF